MGNAYIEKMEQADGILLGAEIATGDLEGVGEAAGLDWIDLAGGDGGKELGDGELDRFGVFQRREAEGWEMGELGGSLAVFH